MEVVGADGAKRGWVAVAVRDGRFAAAALYASAVELAAAFPAAPVIGIDIPIGLPTDGVRSADRLARRFVGARRSSVFAAPPQAVLEAATYAEARAVAEAAWVQSVSSQAYRLGPRILEVATLGDARLIEVHPEVSFRALAGRPLSHAKKTWNGLMERRALLRSAGIELPDRLAAGSVAPDDLVDAAAVAWSAARYAAGDARCLPHPPEPGLGGRAVAIWC